MNQFLFSVRSRAIATCGVLATLTSALALLPSSGSAALLRLRPDTSKCTYPTLTQPYSSLGDANWYFLAPGQALDSFSGSGWSLSGGAKVKSTTLASGRTGPVLDLPRGSRAVSPPICVKYDFQYARMLVRSLSGSQGVHVSATYDGINLLGIAVSLPRDSGTVRGSGTWGVSTPIDVRPNGTSSWQVVRFTLTPQGTSGDSQIYNFYVDPRMKG